MVKKITRLPTEGEHYTRCTTSFYRPQGGSLIRRLSTPHAVTGAPVALGLPPLCAAPEPCSPVSRLRPFQLPDALFEGAIRVLFPSLPFHILRVLYYAVLRNVKGKIAFFDIFCYLVVGLRIGRAAHGLHPPAFHFQTLFQIFSPASNRLQ